MSWYTDIKTWIANNIRTNHQREITGAKMNTVLNDIVDEVEKKVDKVSGKGLSTNDYTDTDKAKVTSALQTETDPTVPSWAKAQTKPTYTASEVGAIPATDKGANGGVATLDNAGKVPQSQLPSYVDDVLEYSNLASFPATGESGKIYVALDTNKIYRWSGSAYVEISQGLALGETSSTAFPGDRGKAIEDKIPSNASSSNKLATKAEMVPAGGTTGQVLAKKSDTDNDLEWVNQSGGGGTVDPYPTEDSTNPVQSGGVYEDLNNLYQALSVAKNCLFGGLVTRLESPSQGDDHRYYYITQQVGYFPHFDVTIANDEPTAGMIYWSEILSKWVTIGLWPKLDYVDKKANKVSNATQGNLAGLDSDGNLNDSGKSPSDFATAAQGGKADTAVQQVTVGTTTTGNAGTNASVTNSGTATAPVLNFTIPRGSDGQDGADAVNPFKGWWPDLATLKAAHIATEGDYAYVMPAVNTDPVSIYEYDSTASTDNYWADSRRTFNPSNNQEFASGEDLNTVNIVNDFTTGGARNVFSAEAGRNVAANMPVGVEEDGFFIVDQNMNIGLAFVDGELIMPSKYFGKKLSILGDSISTFGTPDQNNATGIWTYPNNRCRYPQDNLFTDVKYCWWKKLLDKTGMVLGINESWAGSRVSNTSATDTGDVGPNRCISSLTRIGHLDDNGTPDIIIVYAGTNDIGQSVTIGTFDTTSPQDLTEQQIAALDVTTFAAAYRAMLIRLQYYYRNSRIIVCMPNFTSTYYNTANLDEYIEVIKEECDYFGVEVIDLRDSGITMYNSASYLPDGIHPNPSGMELLFENIYNYLINN